MPHALYLLGLAIVAGSGVYHLVMGGASAFSTIAIRRLAGRLYALEGPQTLDPRFEYGLKPLGAMALAVAAWCLLATWRGGACLADAEAVLIVLFILRAAFRFLYRDLFRRAFGVDWTRSRTNVVFNLGLAMILLLCLVGGVPTITPP